MGFPIVEINFLSHLEGINNIYITGHEDGPGLPDENLYSTMLEHKGVFCPMEQWNLLYTKKKNISMITKKLLKNQFRIYFERISPLSSKIYKNQIFIIAENSTILDIIKDFLHEWKPKFERLCQPFEEEIKKRKNLNAEKMMDIMSKYDEIHEKMILTLPMIDKIYDYYGENKDKEDHELEADIKIDPFRIIKLIDEYKIVSKEKGIISNMVKENHFLEKYINKAQNIISYYFKIAISGRLNQIKKFYTSKLPRIVKKFK